MHTYTHTHTYAYISQKNLLKFKLVVFIHAFNCISVCMQVFLWGKIYNVYIHAFKIILVCMQVISMRKKYTMYMCEKITNYSINKLALNHAFKAVAMVGDSNALLPQQLDGGMPS